MNLVSGGKENGKKKENRAKTMTKGYENKVQREDNKKNVMFELWSKNLWSDFGFLALGRWESCGHFQDLQKSIVILLSGAVWTRNVTLLMKTLTP